jgi:DNA polymerase-3 subunit delta'
VSADSAGPPEADRFAGAPHPRETFALAGHQAAEAALLEAYRSGRMHHAWLITGPAGIGRATLAYRLARFILAHPDPAAPAVQRAADLAVAPADPAARQVAAQSHPDLMVLRRAWNPDRKTPAAEIRIDDARRVAAFFGATAGAGGWRIAIVDTADDLNTAAANALLKVLEEPPPRALFLLVCEVPRRLPPTIRSRCRLLPLAPLSAGEVEAVLQSSGLAAGREQAEVARVAAAADGSVRRAAALMEGDALALRAAVADLLARLPALDHAATLTLAERVAGGEGASRFTLMTELVLDWLHTRAAAGAAAGEGRLARWAELWEKTARTAREAEIYNLDRRPLVLAMVAELAAAAQG